MNAALIHDKVFIKTFWEKRITNHSQMTEDEELRMKNSALTKLRDEWLIRLECQRKNIKNFNNRHATMSTEVKQTDQE
ncbi:protein FAM240B [Ictalurus punctatus]|uniref:Protein FAM240B n=1 Tax=Ictalurus punctatus TaxID=7998 RepID=A0A2D0R2Q0_ICTPU|nr:protein FAM240B [Ictalurus punctatus]XP_017324328.1 protein FAM240B [Ictalurus punctatus]